MNTLLILVGIIFLISIIVGLARGFIKIAASFATTIVIVVLVAFLTPHASGLVSKITFIEEMAERKGLEILMLKPSEDLVMPEYTREEQISLIENANLPEVFQQLLIENNNSEVYKALGLTDFGEYVVSYLAKTITSILSFLITLLVVAIIVRTAIYVLGIISELPIVGGVNRLAGGALGLVTGLIVVWILFIAITLVYDTGIGETCFEYIAESKILTILYEKNILMNYIMKFRA